MEKYMYGHLKGQRNVWNAHWLAFGNDHGHINFAPEALTTFIKWWPTHSTVGEAQMMSDRRAKVNTSSTFEFHYVYID